MIRPHLPPVPLSLYLAMTLQYAVGGAFLPFVTLVLKDRGLGYDQLGWVHFSSAAVGSSVPFLWGWIADRWVRTERLLAGLHLAGGAALYLFSRQTTFGGLLSAYAALFTVYAPTTALLSALAYHNLASPEAQFGRIRLCGSLGWMAPSLPVYLWLLLRGEKSADLSFTLRFAAALEILAAVTCARLPATPPSAKAALIPYSIALRRLFRRRGFAEFLAVIFLAHSSFAVLFYYSAPVLETAGFDRRYIGPLQCLGVAVEPLLLLALPRVIGRLGFHGTIVLGCSMLLLRQVVYALPSPPWLLAWSYVLAGGCVAFYLTAASLSLNAMADRSVRASAQALLAIVGAGLGQMFGHRAVGWIASHRAGGLEGAFVFAVGTSGAALFILVFSLRGKGLFSAERG